MKLYCFIFLHLSGGVCVRVCVNTVKLSYTSNNNIRPMTKYPMVQQIKAKFIFRQLQFKSLDLVFIEH